MRRVWVVWVRGAVIRVSDREMYAHLARGDAQPLRPARLEFGDQTAGSLRGAIAEGSHRVNRLALRVGQIPVDVTLARDVDAQLAHDLDDLGVHMASGIGDPPRRLRA